MKGADPSFEILYKHESLLLADVLIRAPASLIKELRELAI